MAKLTSTDIYGSLYVQGEQTTGSLTTTGSFKAPNGSASSPSYTFSGDLNTGIYIPSADTLAFTTNGVEKLRIESNGDLTAIAGAKLFLYNSSNYLSYNTWTSSSSASSIINSNTTDGKITLFTSSLERMRIDKDGRVGIGTTIPGTINSVAFSGVGLHTKADTQGRTITEGSGTAEFIMNDSGASANQRIKAISSDGGNLYLRSYDDNGTVRNHVTIDNNGNATFSGDLTVQGTNFIANTTTVKTEDDIIQLRSAATLAMTGYAGLVATKYDGTNDGALVFNSSGEARIGDMTIQPDGSLVDVSSQPIMTRDETGNLSNLDIMVWDSANYRSIGKTIAELGLTPASGGTYNEITVTNDDIAGVPLNINAITGTTAHLQDWRVNGTILSFFLNDGGLYVPRIANTTTSNNASIAMNTTGVNISRNIADANPSLVVNQNHASSTGNIVNFQKEGTTLAYITNGGAIYGTSFYDLNNGSFFLDPSSTGTSINTAGNITTAGDINITGRLGVGITNTSLWKTIIKGDYGLQLQKADGTAIMEYNTATGNLNNRYLNGARIEGYNQNLEIDTNASTYDIILAKTGGDVGIGTTSPSTKLEVSGIGTQTIKVTSTDAVQAGLYLQRGTIADGSHDVHLFNNNGTFKIQSITPSVLDRLTILSDGKVGIGNASPTARLSIHDADSATTYFQLTNNATGTSLTDGFNLLQSGLNTVLINRENGMMAFETNNTEKMRILSTGEVGIGTASPSSPLHVKGASAAIKIDRDTNNYGASLIFAEAGVSKWQVKDDASGDNLNKFQVMNATEDVKFTILQDGKTGIGTSTPAETLEIYGKSKSQDLIISDASNVAKVTMKYDSTSKSLKFSFA